MSIGDELVLRAEGAVDEAEVARASELTRRAFGDDHAAVLLDALRRSNNWRDLGFVAELRGQPVGDLAFTRCFLDAPRAVTDVLMLSPVGVVPEVQGQGIGSALIRYGLAQLDRRGEPLVFLEGSPRYYPRFGFRPGEQLGFRTPSLQIPDRAFQVLALRSYESWMTGTFVYSQVIWGTGGAGFRESGQ